MTHDRSATQAAGQPLDWPAVLAKHRVQYLILNAEQEGDLLERFQSAPDWTIDYEDGGTVLLRRHQRSHGGSGL